MKIPLILFLSALISGAAPAAEYWPSMRPLPVPVKREIAPGPKFFVDAAKGNDTQNGAEATPWKTLGHAVRQLKPGDTLYLRGGVYFEKVALTQSGAENAPITIGSYPGELAILDGSLREFQENPAASWEPFPSGAEGEYISTRAYPGADNRRMPVQFLPASWEPMWGKEAERPLALGHFADHMIPLHGYRLAVDLRSANEFWLGGKNEMLDVGLYGGPGLWYNRETGRIHIRLAHHKLEGLGEHAYRGETDPRKLRLIVAVGFGDEVLRVNGVRHVRLQDLVVRGATGSPLVQIYGSEHVALDHLTLYGGFPGLHVNASQNLAVTHCALRGLAAPWTSRAHMKYRGTASYQIVFGNNQPGNENIEFSHCEFTDDHDFAFLRYVKNLQFHHNFVDNFNDDGLEIGPKLRGHTLYIYQNRLGRALIPFSQHEIEVDESPVDHDAAAGVFIFRNVIDLRGGVFRSPPAAADPSGAFLREEGHLAGDHGGPVWPVMRVYHNTILRETPTFRDYFLMGLGTQGLKHSERDVFNNIFVQMDKVPGTGFAGIKEPGNLREGGNILWGVKEGPAMAGTLFDKFRASPIFAASKQWYEPGFTTQDVVADPKFVGIPKDLRLQADSPALRAGVPVPAAWPDPLRVAEDPNPDSGALPHGAEAWGVGVDGRIPLGGE